MNCTRMNNIIPELMWKYIDINFDDLIILMKGVNCIPGRSLRAPDIIKPIVDYKRKPIIRRDLNDYIKL